MHKIDFRNLSKEAQAEIRRRAVFDYLSMGGRSKKKLAKIYQISPNMVGKWVANYKKYGKKSFNLDRRGAKKFQNTSLTKRQLNWLCKQIKNKTPEQLELPFALWTRKLVAELIERKFGIKINLSTAGNYLKSFGMTPQKPVLKSYKQQSELVQKWLTQEYPEVETRAKAQKALIFWGDETAGDE